jgi:hypothetical protein
MILGMFIPCFSIEGQTRYIQKYQTIAHKFIALDEAALKLNEGYRTDHFDSAYHILDRIIARSEAAITAIIKSPSSDNRADAIRILQSIDQVLLEENFVVCIQVENLSAGLTLANPKNLKCYQYRPNGSSTINDKHYCIDCDLSAMIFYSVGEVMHLPINFIEVPGHNFVRWRFSEMDYINWDNNSARTYTDDDFRDGRSPTSNEPFSRKEEENLHYLKDMSATEMEAYYNVIIAGILKNNQHYKEAEQRFLYAINSRPYDALAMNNLSWMYLTVPSFKDSATYQKAYNLSVKVDQLSPKSIEYRDTFSCACAAVGKFDSAIKVEKTARNKPERIKAFEAGKTCLDLGEQ